MRLIINFLAFQLGWFASVLGAAHGIPWAGPAVVVMVVLIHLGLVRRPLPELCLVAAAMSIGLVVDSALMATGWLRYSTGLWFSGLAPYWIVGMWGLFATTLNVSMAWLRGRPAWAVVLGGVGGPASYFAGEKLGAIELVPVAPALAALALAWALSMPLLMRLATRFDGVSPGAVPDYVRRDWRVSNHV